MLILLFLFFFGDNDYPEWFLNPPRNSIAVLIEDQYTFESRFINLYLKANSVLQMEKNEVFSIGYDAYRESNALYSRNDKYKIEYDYNKSDEIDYIDKFGYQLTDIYRVKGDVVFGLFEKVSTKKSLKVRNSIKWTEEKSNSISAVGTSNGSNYLKSSNWKEAFEHALFQLTMNNNVSVFSDVDQRKFEDGSFTLDQQTNEQINIVKYKFKGIHVSNRYYDEKENVYFLRIEVKR